MTEKLKSSHGKAVMDADQVRAYVSASANAAYEGAADAWAGRFFEGL